MLTSTPICVIGAGTMGRGIAQIALAAGHPVTLIDPVREQLDAAAQEIEKRLTKRSSEIAESLSERLSLHTQVDSAEARPNTVVIEAVLESLDVKVSVLSEAGRHFGEECVLATNTSSLSVTQIAAGCPVPDRVVGMHFFNPVPVMGLVEVITGVQTNPEVTKKISDLAEAWGKQVARVRSSPGFIVNRVARGFYGEALRLVEEQVASPESIDEVFRSAGGFRMGPFELIDLIGNEVNAAVTRSVWTAFNFDPRFEPSRIQEELVAAGRFGRKSGQGFYSYADGTAQKNAVCASPTELPASVEFGGECSQLQTLLSRSGVPIRSATQGSSDAILPDGTVIMVTRGRTARNESAVRGGVPVVVLDRCLSPTSASGLALSTSSLQAIGAAAALLAQAGITAFPVDDAPGLILARTLALIANEAWETALHGIASPEDIDLAMRLGTNYPVGPFEWTERWGPVEVANLLNELWTTYHDPRYRTSRRLREAQIQTASGQLDS